MTKNSVKHPETWITVLLILATLIMMIASQLIGKPSHYFTFVALPTISVFFWMQYARIKYSTHKRLWLMLVLALNAWSLIFITSLFCLTVG